MGWVILSLNILYYLGASTVTTLSDKKGGLAPLHIAAAIPGSEGVAITELLLNSLANPDVRAAENDSFLNRLLEEEWSKDKIDDDSRNRSGGRTPLHIASARDDNYWVRASLSSCRNRNKIDSPDHLTNSRGIHS